MLILALDSSRKQLSISLFDTDSNKTLFSFSEEHKSSQLMPILVSLFEQAQIKPQELGLLACCTGPGSFTGLRTTLTIIKTMAAELQLPVFAINNFELLRFQHGLASDEALLMNAGKNDYFVSLNSDYANPETNFFALQDQGLGLIDFAEANTADLIIDYLLKHPESQKINYKELEPYYLREPSINK
jgi:tRNA threonylcarbamoyl adenosine modification protein YeaZ